MKKMYIHPPMFSTNELTSVILTVRQLGLDYCYIDKNTSVILGVDGDSENEKAAFFELARLQWHAPLRS